MIRVGIVGATGYTALELLKILIRHPHVQISCLTSRDATEPSLDLVHPSLRGLLPLSLVNFDVDSFANQVDCAFCCLPHAASAEVVKELVARNIKVIDFSADYRLNDIATFEHWYQVQHPDPERVGQVPYGIPELFRPQLQQAELIANPGCFPSSVLLPLVPLLKADAVESSPIIVDSKTGISGAGRKPALKFHFPECNESVTAYGVGTHRHAPEIDQIIFRATAASIETIFTPHLIPMDRGILSTIYLREKTGHTVSNLLKILKEHYQDEPFIRISDNLPTTKDVSGTNFCDIGICQNRQMLVVVSALDNLIKGASGAAVQNFNVMFGFPETTGLL